MKIKKLRLKRLELNMSIYTFLKDEINNLTEREILKIFYALHV